MRDLERWKDKVELSLDGRQIFFLFFGSAVAACLIFVAGVLVGKRVAERAVAAAPAAEDPLAALDRLGAADEDDGLTFHQTLAPERHGRAAPKQRADKPEAPAPEARPERPEAKPDKPEAKPENGRFTLQLSAFVEKDDAQRFMQKMQSAGFKPFLVQSDIPGRGIFYRVRVGDYPTRKAANDARGELERKEHVLAYVAKL